MKSTFLPRILALFLMASARGSLITAFRPVASARGIRRTIALWLSLAIALPNSPVCALRVIENKEAGLEELEAALNAGQTQISPSTQRSLKIPAGLEEELNVNWTDKESLKGYLRLVRWTEEADLTPLEIDLIAEAILKEFKRNGPFRNQNDFSNRMTKGVVEGFTQVFTVGPQDWERIASHLKYGWSRKRTLLLAGALLGVTLFAVGVPIYRMVKADRKADAVERAELEEWKEAIRISEKKTEEIEKKIEAGVDTRLDKLDEEKLQGNLHWWDRQRIVADLGWADYVLDYPALRQRVWERFIQHLTAPVGHPQREEHHRVLEILIEAVVHLSLGNELLMNRTLDRLHALQIGDEVRMPKIILGIQTEFLERELKQFKKMKSGLEEELVIDGKIILRKLSERIVRYLNDFRQKETDLPVVRDAVFLGSIHYLSDEENRLPIQVVRDRRLIGDMDLYVLVDPCSVSALDRWDQLSDSRLPDFVQQELFPYCGKRFKKKIEISVEAKDARELLRSMAKAIFETYGDIEWDAARAFKKPWVPSEGRVQTNPIKTAKLYLALESLIGDKKLYQSYRERLVQAKDPKKEARLVLEEASQGGRKKILLLKLGEENTVSVIYGSLLEKIIGGRQTFNAGLEGKVGGRKFDGLTIDVAGKQESAEFVRSGLEEVMVVGTGA